jgi:ribose-phosphate pyrophosphokinase
MEFKSFTFSGGEKHIKLLHPAMSDTFEIHTHLTSSDAIFELILMVDALRRTCPISQRLSLFCPYLPYARQDRVMVPGEPLSVRVMCDLINSLKFDRVTVADVHSDVSMALLDRVANIDVKDLLRDSGIPMDSCILVAPDAGALKKVGSVAKHLELPMVRADKIRDVTDGSIKETVVYFNQTTDKDFLIVDDICDGGRTFIELAKKLRPLTTSKVFLYVTHGIFSQGLAPFKGLIDKIFVAYPFPGVDLSDPLIMQIHNQDFMKG